MCFTLLFIATILHAYFVIINRFVTLFEIIKINGLVILKWSINPVQKLTDQFSMINKFCNTAISLVVGEFSIVSNSN